MKEDHGNQEKGTGLFSKARDSERGTYRIPKPENGQEDWAYYWSNTTHQQKKNGTLSGKAASYVAFGRSMGFSKKLGKWVDVHGAGSQRSD